MGVLWSTSCSICSSSSLMPAMSSICASSASIAAVCCRHKRAALRWRAGGPELGLRRYRPGGRWIRGHVRLRVRGLSPQSVSPQSANVTDGVALRRVFGRGRKRNGINRYDTRSNPLQTESRETSPSARALIRPTRLGLAEGHRPFPRHHPAPKPTRGPTPPHPIPTPRHAAGSAAMM